MLWLLAGVVVLWLAVAFAGFRRMLAILAGIAVLGFIPFVAWARNDQNTRDQEEQAAKQRLPHELVDLTDLRMDIGRESTQLKGRIRNNDPQYTLIGLELRLHVRECATPERCEAIGDKLETIQVDVPPQQAREIDHYATFYGLGRPRATRTWSYDVVSVSGR